MIKTKLQKKFYLSSDSPFLLNFNFGIQRVYDSQLEWQLQQFNKNFTSFDEYTLTSAKKLCFVVIFPLKSNLSVSHDLIPFKNAWVIEFRKFYFLRKIRKL